MPKPKVLPTAKPAIKYDKNGNRILPGTGYTTKNERMPELKRPGGIAGKAVNPPKKTASNNPPKKDPKVKIPSMIGSSKMKSKYTQLPRKIK